MLMLAYISLAITFLYTYISTLIPTKGAIQIALNQIVSNRSIFSVIPHLLLTQDQIVTFRPHRL
jgi:hypothetical protein